MHRPGVVALVIGGFGLTVLAIVVNLVILIGGLQAIRTLNVRQYPRLDSATVTVKTAYIGANAAVFKREIREGRPVSGPPSSLP